MATQAGGNARLFLLVTKVPGISASQETRRLAPISALARLKGRVMKRAVPFLMLAALAASAFAQPAPDKTMVVVNGDKITGANYVKRMEVLPGVGMLINGRFLEGTPGYLTLQQMINETLMIQLAKDKGVAPTEAQITQEIQDRLKDNPEFAKIFEQMGLTQADLRYDILVQMSEFNLMTMGINIADAQVTRYYEDQKKDFTLPKRYRLRVIAVSSADAKKAVDADIAAGKAFAEIAKERSEDITTKYDGGLMGDIAEEALNANLKPLVIAMKPGQSTAWLKGSAGPEVKVFLESVQESRVLPLDDKLKRQIRRKLMMERGSVRNNVPQWMEEKRKAAKMEFQGTPFDEQLKRVFGPKQ